jgi:hypothetical protein
MGRHVTEGLGIVGATLGPAMIAKLVDMPSVREWLTRPPEGELEGLQQVPYADRIKIVDGLNKVVEKAKEEGRPIKVAPNVAQVLAAGSAAKQQPDDKKEEPSENTEPQAYTGHTHVYDPDSGSIVPVQNA